MNATRPRVLMVDDEPNVLAAYRRALVRRYDLTVAESGPRALELIGELEPFPVIVTDMRMPEMDGLEFLRLARPLARTSVSIMLTGNADQQTAVRAINEGRIFRFLTKPCDPVDLDQALRAAVRQHELVTAEQVLLRDTLTGSVKLLVEALALSDPDLHEASRSIRQSVQVVLRRLGLDAEWRFPIAASLCLLGVVVETDARGDGWVDESRLDACARTAAALLRHIPRLGDVASIIERQREDGPLPETLDLEDASARITIGARVLRFALDVERHLRSHGFERVDLEGWLAGRLEGDGHDPRRVSCLGDLLAGRPTPGDGPGLPPATTCSTLDLRPGMILATDVLTEGDKLLLSSGQSLSLLQIQRLRSLARTHGIEDRIVVIDPGGGRDEAATRRSPAA